MSTYGSMSHRLYVVFGVGSCLALAACAVGPDFKTPAADVPSTWVHDAQAAPSRPASGEIAADWWRIYNDPLLPSLEQQVSESNLDLQAAAFRYAESRAERTIAGAAQFPMLSGAASYARERASPNGVLGLLGTGTDNAAGTVATGQQGFGPSQLPGYDGGSAFDLPQYGLSASWEVDLWGHVRRSVESAGAAARATDDMRRDILVSLMATTARDYIDLRAVQAQIAITHQNLDLSKHSVNLTQLRFRNGATTSLDVSNADAQYDAIQSRLPDLERQQTHLVNALSFLMAREPGALAQVLAVSPGIPSVPDIVPVGLPSELAERRPDIRVAEERLHAATANVGVAVADFYPRVTLSGSLDIQALQFSGLGDFASRQYGFGPTISLPIFQGGRLRGQLHLRKAQQKEAAISYQRVVLSAWHEIDDAMADFNAAQRRRDRLDAATKENRRALEVAQIQYAQGASDFLNVLTVQNQLLATQSELVEAQAATAVSLTQLYKALGGGWEKAMPLNNMRNTGTIKHL